MNQNNTIDKTISLYQHTGWKRFFAKGRFWYAPFAEVEALLPKKGKVIDLGCGEGIFTNYIGLSSSERNVRGIEIDPKRFILTNHGVKNVIFQLEDISKSDIPPADAIILFHVLHHLPSYKAQEALIKKCVHKLKVNGKIIIVEIYVKPTLQ